MSFMVGWMEWQVVGMRLHIKMHGRCINMPILRSIARFMLGARRANTGAQGHRNRRATQAAKVA
jgi:hypothetical protein